MERKKNILIILLVLPYLYLAGQSNENIYQAYISSNMDLWKNTIDSLEKRPVTSLAEKLELINYQYGYTGWCIDQNKMNEANNMIERSEKLILILERRDFNLSMVYAYKAALIGFRIGIAPYKAPLIGMKSKEYAEKSMDINPENTMAIVQLGNICYYKPKLFGGSKKEAIVHYNSALKLMEAKPAELKNNWNYLNLLATIINAYLSLHEFNMAKQYCEKALSIEPSFDWVKNTLYPQTLKELNDE